MLNNFEYRICPTCNRLLYQGPNNYVCRTCWLVFNYEQTLPHPNTEGLKQYIFAGEDEKYRYLMDSKKLLTKPVDLIEEQKMYSEILLNRKEVIETDKKIAQDIEKSILREEAYHSVLKQLNKINPSELENVKFETTQ